MISTGVSSMRDRICAITHPTARPIAHPPTAAMAKVVSAPVHESAPPTATATAIL